MALGAGKKQGEGVVVGVWNEPSAMKPRKGKGVFREVLAVLRRHHRVNARLDDSSYQETIVKQHRESAPIRSSNKGTVIRMVIGSGKLLTDSGNTSMHYGDWAYIPPGVAFQMGGGVPSGFTFAMATLV